MPWRDWVRGLREAEAVTTKSRCWEMGIGHGQLEDVEGSEASDSWDKLQVKSKA